MKKINNILDSISTKASEVGRVSKGLGNAAVDIGKTACDASLEIAKSAADAVLETGKIAGNAALNVSKTAGVASLEITRTTGKAAKDVVITTTTLISDLNDDGKVDKEDAKIATDKAKEVVAAVADESAKLGKEVMRSELVKDVAAHAAIGALIAVPVPLVGPAFGAITGASLGHYKSTEKKK